jgi:hypothetical protein
MLACICAIDRAALPDLMNYWVTGAVDVTGVHELVGNALILPGEKKRETNLRGEPCREWRKRLMTDKGKMMGNHIFHLGGDFRSGSTCSTGKNRRPLSWC